MSGVNLEAVHGNSIEKWREDCLNFLSSHTSEIELFDQALILTQRLDFDYLGFGIQLQALVSLKNLVAHLMSYLDFEIADPNKTILLFDNHPPEVMQIFKTKYSKTDPLIRHAKKSTELLVWSDKVFSEEPGRWALMQEYGLKYGLSQPSRSRTGSVAMAHFTRKANEIMPSELAEKRIKIGILTSVLHAEMEIILMKKFFDELPTLSDLDKSILRWTARGKTATEIAQILGVKERAITTRKTVIAKALNAKTFAQAMLIAYSLGFMV
jgi:LuxR family transcriptional regulator, quorum-sensing system regulator SolR